MGFQPLKRELGRYNMVISKQSLYFYAGVANALIALAIIPIRTTTIGQSHVGAHLLGSAPSFFGLLALLMLLFSAIKPKASSTFWIIVIIITAGTLAHEILQNWTGRVFDYLDIIAILCGFLTFCLINIITGRLSKTRPNQRVEPTPNGEAHP